MILYPAIDLKDGNCIRMIKGDMMSTTVYNDNAMAQAAAFKSKGFSWLHVVDLNGALSGKSVNKPIVERIVKEIAIPVQVGGGIRDRASVEAWLETGVARVILGTAAVKNPQFVHEVAKAYPDRIVISIDARESLVATDGWVQGSRVRDSDLAQRFADSGIAALIYTDIGSDGSLAGPNIAATAAIARMVQVPVILSGGIKTADHIAQILAEGSIQGAIIGRALYERTLDVPAVLGMTRKTAAVKAAPPPPAAPKDDIW